jgi:hypothetical protein
MGGIAGCSECHAIGAGLTLIIQIKHVYQEKCAPELGLKMCTRAGIGHVYQNQD